MSYILDALKKLESEKSKKSRSDGMVNIAGALLRDEPRRASSGSGIAWKVAAVVVSASLATFAATWFVLHADKKQERPKSPPIMQTPPVARVAPPVASPPVAPVQPPSAPVPSPEAPEAPEAPAPATKPPTPSVLPPKPQAVVPSASVADDDVSVGKQVERPKKQKKQDVRSVAAERPEAQTLSPAPADIKVSGIAWQDERNARRAVVNGFLLHEGSVVSGARVTDILKDRVRFSSGDKNFEVPLLMSIVPGAAK